MPWAIERSSHISGLEEVMGLLLSAEKRSPQTVVETTFNFQNFEGSDVDVTSQRLRSDWNLMGGAGIMIKTGFDRILLEARYKRGFRNVVREEARFENDELLYTYYQLDDDFRLHNFEFSIGFIHRFSLSVNLNQLEMEEK